MNLTPIQVKAFLGLLGFTAVGLVMSACFHSGITQGENNINVLWQKDKLEQATKMAELQEKIQKQEFGHRQETDRIAVQLRKTEVDYEKASAALAAERTQRLRLSTERAALYSRLAEAGPDQCRGLASHAAELDRTLEEGRSLVGELRSALGQREDQLRLLGAQIINDRKLLEAH